ncbi:DeoR/GlpR transcriptional regulator [Leucobacter sp. CSA1]|uniref:DeoR/GlpR transcriptional regulator n=1 Tax=Leucobacter chromiisoli TaxID=2796471 RepID=A0A934UUU2_9MICO|nr:DeoR/GlpR family DNA-binding transcription regulator [Leucobacter chromiisoli]MBK0418791.1 DeoR/GlpR transcriptional regulator [Leucobacter chromiisoli]
MNANTRRSLIEEMIAQQGEVSLVDLAEKFGVSEMTVRRDLDVLEEDGVLRKVMGGAIFIGGKSTEPSFHARAAAAAEEKHHLAEIAVGLLKPRQTVILDSGSTVLAVAREIKGKGLGLTVVTPSVLAAVELADEPDTTVLVTGGRLRPGELSLIGSEAEDAFLRYNCDVYFMGVAGVDAVRGASEYHREEGAVKRYAARSADRVIAVVDQSKLGRVQLINVVDAADIDAVVTDAPEDHPTVMQLRESGVVVHRTAAPGEK